MLEPRLTSTPIGAKHLVVGKFHFRGNMSELYYTIFKSQAGWIGLSGSAGGLSRTTLPLSSEDQAVNSLGSDGKSYKRDTAFFAGLIDKLQAYFEGCRVEFTETIDLSEASLFQRKVWLATRSITYGETRSYGWVAKQIRQPQAARAVGQALNANPLPVVVPCHRVIASSGRLCGFAGGLETKQLLITLEAHAKTV
jgi:methylated-DNA-[protein]-cysteine S-methyltransferase